MKVEINLTNVDSIILGTLLAEMYKVAGKAASNFGKSPAESTIDPVGKEPRKYWLNVTNQIHLLIDDLVEAIDRDDDYFFSQMSLDFFAQDFLTKELAAMAQRVSKEAWLQFDTEVRNKILKRTSFVVYELRCQVAGVEQLKMFEDDQLQVKTFQMMPMQPEK